MATDEPELTRSEKLLALLLLAAHHEASQQDKIVLLKRGGFSNSDTAEILGTTAGVVRQSLYAAKSASKRRPRKRK